MPIKSWTPFTSQRAALETIAASEDDGTYGPQIKTEQQVLWYKEGTERVGETFSQWFTLKDGALKPGTKARDYVECSLGEDYDPAKELEVKKLVGTRFMSEVGLNKKGTHSLVVHETIGPYVSPVKEKRQLEKAQQEAQAATNVEIDELPYEAPF